MSAPRTTPKTVTHVGEVSRNWSETGGVEVFDVEGNLDRVLDNALEQFDKKKVRITITEVGEAKNP
ncbi:MAG: hypothetical protein KGJ23_07885 [Euryarchaeota archaeon]|nr:hypothetical protein [Euryarchaeota archaeon]MDE1836520.1 hypothetical protein [Euryarchaeota archaeon]MDE1879285.1 hypothetical protein [Euryarchaeota archaeon]MDE2044490.1 hypothetical protein [Thermoplasmata archaeon]